MRTGRRAPKHPRRLRVRYCAPLDAVWQCWWPSDNNMEEEEKKGKITRDNRSSGLLTSPGSPHPTPALGAWAFPLWARDQTSHNRKPSLGLVAKLPPPHRQQPRGQRPPRQQMDTGQCKQISLLITACSAGSQSSHFLPLATR